MNLKKVTTKQSRVETNYSPGIGEAKLSLGSLI